MRQVVRLEARDQLRVMDRIISLAMSDGWITEVRKMLEASEGARPLQKLILLEHRTQKKLVTPELAARAAGVVAMQDRREMDEAILDLADEHGPGLVCRALFAAGHLNTNGERRKREASLIRNIAQKRSSR